MWSASSGSPSAGRPEEPSGLGEAYVPLASMTARARTRSRVPCARDDELERRRVAVRVAELVPQPPRYGERPRCRVGCGRGAPGSGQRQELVVAQLGARRVLVVGGALPAALGEQPLGGAIDDAAPRREQRHVAPLGDRRAAARRRARAPAARSRAPARCAAAARPTGPAPMTTTGRDSSLARAHGRLLTSIEFDGNEA